MSKENAQERMERLKREREEAKKTTPTNDLVGQLTHETSGEPDFAEIAARLKMRQAKEARGENDGYVKMTIYIREDIAEGFNALITKRGQQKEFANAAFADFIQKKAREMNLY